MAGELGRGGLESSCRLSGRGTHQGRGEQRSAPLLLGLCNLLQAWSFPRNSGEMNGAQFIGMETQGWRSRALEPVEWVPQARLEPGLLLCGAHLLGLFVDQWVAGPSKAHLALILLAWEEVSRGQVSKSPRPCQREAGGCGGRGGGSLGGVGCSAESPLSA